MIFGNEGMPRSGKSLDSIQHVIDSLNAGRTVVTNVYGLNYQALSEYLGIPLPTVQRLLITLAPPADLDEELKVQWVKEQFLKHQLPNCLWIWDEINQFWPPERQPLPAAWSKLVTEHGQNGMDILVMGQDLAELHSTWRKRLQRYTRFTKLDMQGKEDQYHWASWTNVGRNKYRKMGEGKKPYNKDFFPLYKSHRDTTSNKGNYKDGRFSVFQTKHKVYAAGFFAVLGWGLWTVYDFFTPEPAEAAASVQQQPDKPAQDQPAPPPAPEPSAAEPPPAQPQQREPIDYLDKFASQYDLRLSGIMDRLDPQPGKPAFEFTLDFLDEGYRVKERMGREDVASLGWSIERKPYGIRIYKDGVEYIARAWPLDNWGKVPNETTAAIKANAL